MAFIKCPRCELNYILDGENLCTVCRREVRGESEPVDIADLCSECGENPVLPGEELCLFCIKELNRGVSLPGEEAIAPGGAAIEIDSVSAMDEIVLDTVDPAFSSDDDFAKDDDKDEADGLHEVEEEDDDPDDEDYAQ
jgi:hypothetical protein